MYDPMTVAFEIKRPWPKRIKSTTHPKSKSRMTYYPPLATIWHVDPEKRGDDDSCGWFAPSQTKEDEAFVAAHAARLRDQFFGEHGQMYGASTYDVVVALWCEVKHRHLCLRKGYYYAPLSRREEREVRQLCVSPVDNLHSVVQRARTSPDGMEWLLGSIIRNQRRILRPWYKHPRWHLSHWKIQVHFVQNLKRWAFSRCNGCGGRFSWGYSPVTTQWGGSGPLWFRSESKVYHQDCVPNNQRPSKATSQPLDTNPEQA